jgi:hypothetical protein
LEKDRNYAAWKGDDGSGKSKRAITSEIKALLVEAGIHRTTTQIRDKMFDIFRKFNQAMDWMCQTGNGLMGNPDEEQSVRGIHKRF